MNLGIVGHEAAKFTPQTEEAAKQAIRQLLAEYRPAYVVSGHCHLGGVDIWAEEIAKELDYSTIIHAPRARSWNAPGGYKERNLRIAEDSDLVACIVVANLPPNYLGMRFQGCYHCGRSNPPHVKSGGCWTAWKCLDRKWVIL